MTTSSGKPIGYARVSTRHQNTDCQVVDLAAADVRRDDLCVDHGTPTFLGALAQIAKS